MTTYSESDIRDLASLKRAALGRVIVLGVVMIYAAGCVMSAALSLATL